MSRHLQVKYILIRQLLGSCLIRIYLISMCFKTAPAVRRDIDEGWAWFVMVGAFLGLTIYASALFMGGVIYTALLERYREGAAKTSLVGSLSYGCLCCLAPVAGIVMNKFSCRVAIVCGGALSSAGFALSAFAPSLDWTIATAGFLAGTGFSLTSAGLVCVLGYYFKKWRDQMIAMAFIFLGTGMFISAPLGNYLLETQGLVGTFLVIAGIQAQVCVVGIVCKPSVLEVEVHTRRKVVRKENSQDKFSQYLDVTLLRNVPFVCFLMSTTVWNFALCVALMHLPNYLTILGGSDMEINLLMTSFAVANVTGRVIGLAVVSKLKEKSLTVHVVVLFLTGLITTLFPYYASVQGGMYIFSLQLGVFCGIPNSMMTPVAVNFVGLSKLSEAYGLSFLFCGFGVGTGPFVAGYIYGMTGSYDYSFLVAGVVLLVGAVFGLVANCKAPPMKDEQCTEIKIDYNKKKLKSYHSNTYIVAPETKTLMNGYADINQDPDSNYIISAETKTLVHGSNGITHDSNDKHNSENFLNGKLLTIVVKGNTLNKT